jgi:hypothetical protein
MVSIMITRSSFKIKKGKGVPLHAMEAHGGEEVQLLLILNLGH